MWRWASLLLLLLALALVLMFGGGCGRSARGEPAGEQGPGEAGVPVEVMPAAVETMAERVRVTGTIRALREADVASQFTARVSEVRVREGDVVKAGDVLITLERAQAESQVRQARAGAEAARASLEAARKRLEILEQGARPEERAIARARLEQAQAALRTAEADLSRLRGLFERGAVSRQQLDAAEMAYETARTNRDAARESLELVEQGARPEEVEAARRQVEAAAAQLEQAKAGLAQAEEVLGYTTIRAPISGVVYARNVNPGEIASTMGGPPLLRLADLSEVYYEAPVPERVSQLIQPGQRVEVMLQADGARAVEGRVERVVPVADPRSREFVVRIGIRETGVAVRPGVFARGDIVVRESPEAVVIPKDAVVEREGRSLVFVVKEGTARERSVQLGIADTLRAEVLSGVEAGETVVVVGAQALRDGAAVQVRRAGGD